MAEHWYCLKEMSIKFFLHCHQGIFDRSNPKGSALHICSVSAVLQLGLLPFHNNNFFYAIFLYCYNAQKENVYQCMNTSINRNDKCCILLSKIRSDLLLNFILLPFLFGKFQNWHLVSSWTDSVQRRPKGKNTLPQIQKHSLKFNDILSFFLEFFELKCIFPWNKAFKNILSHSAVGRQFMKTHNSRQISAWAALHFCLIWQNLWQNNLLVVVWIVALVAIAS